MIGMKKPTISNGPKKWLSSMMSNASVLKILSMLFFYNRKSMNWNWNRDMQHFNSNPRIETNVFLIYGDAYMRQWVHSEEFLNSILNSDIPRRPKKYGHSSTYNLTLLMFLVAHWFGSVQFWILNIFVVFYRQT